jgi:uncharacterized protein
MSGTEYPGTDQQHEGIIGVTFDSDAHRLIGVLYLARGGGAKPTVVLLHGCPGLEKNLDLAAVLRDLDHNVLVFHYRGCWGSPGVYNLLTVSRDVTAAVSFLAARPLVDPDRIVVIGHSLGGWAAILAAAADPRLRAVAVYGSAVRLSNLGAGDPERAKERIETEFTGFLATTPAEFIAQCAEAPSALDAVAAIAPRPLLVVHGTDDSWVPLEQARELGKYADRYVEVDGANHAFAWHRKQLCELITGWLEETTCG